MQRPGQPFGVRQPDPAGTGSELFRQHGSGVEAAAQHREHRVPRQCHDRALGITGRARSPLEGSQRHLRLVHPGQLHQGHETPEQAVSFPVFVTRSPTEPDQLGRCGQPVLRAGWIPQGVQARIEHLGQHRIVAGPAGRGQRLVRE